MDCELCGKDAPYLYQKEIEGANLSVCQKCSGVKFAPIKPQFKPNPHITRRIHKKSKPRFQEKEVSIDFGDRIKKAREKKNWTVKELAKKLNEKESYLHRIEHNAVEPTDALSKKIENLLGIDLYSREVIGDEIETTNDDTTMTLEDILMKKLKKE